MKTDVLVSRLSHGERSQLELAKSDTAGLVPPQNNTLLLTQS